MAFNTDTARQAQTKAAETNRLRRADPAKLARQVIVRALWNGDTRVAIEVAREMGILKQERKAQRDDALGEAISMLSQAGVGAPAPTQAAANPAPVNDESTVSHKIFSPGDQPVDNSEVTDDSAE